MNIIKSLLVLLAGASPVISSSAFAQVTGRSGFITSISTTAGSNFPFRIRLTANGANPLSGCIDGFALIPIGNNNYNVMVSSLMLAHAQRKSVIVYTATEPSGYCRIDFIETR